MNTLSPDAWVYDSLNPVRVLQQLPGAFISEDSIAHMTADLHTCGGKALGLSICERLAHGSVHLRVPSWTALSAADLLADSTSKANVWLGHQDDRPVKVRSSTRLEDWLSGDSGIQHSRTVRDPQRVLSHAREISGRRHPVVLQEYREGIGLVVDIAHSQILGQPIVRISTGREQRLQDGSRIFTSATGDHEGRHEVIDPHSGMFLTDRVTGRLFEGSCLRLNLVAIAQELWERVTAMGITFGVQLEIVIHPDAPDVWWLVQIRPSPNQVRSYGRTLTPLSQALTTTPAINRSFQLTTLAQLTDNVINRWILTAAVAGIHVAVEEQGPYQPGGILVWEKDPVEDFNLPMLEAAFHLGAIVQVTRRVTAVSTTHGNVARRQLDDQTNETQGGLIALPDAIHVAVVKQLHQGPRSMTAISDGLVGQIAFL